MASRSVRIDRAGLNKVRQRMAEREKPLNPDKRGWSQKDLAEQAYVDISTVKRFFEGTPRDRGTVISILQALEFDPIKFIAEHDPNPQNSNLDTQPNITIDWQRVCQEMLQEQQEEQRFRRRATEMGFEVNVFVPLGLVERKQQQRRSGNVPMELVNKLEQEVVTRIYEHDEFMTDVIGQNPTGKNKHIAIVGEPGAGKTTLLDKIATHIQENNQDLSICIALASLQGKTLKDYILQEWLPEAISLVYPDIDVEKSHETSLQKRLRQGGVWLLLDGVDEMGETSPAQFEKIRTQLTDWLGKVRVVLTCRTNVWDARLNNPLTGFDTYKTQEFKPEQVDDFIQQWFAEAKNIQRGQELQKKLQEPQKERIRQLVTNPLRLSLLCQIFNKNKQAELPETKAELYQHFVRYFYEWKPAQSGIDWATQPGLQEELHQALGRLSIAGLDSETRFRLPLSLIQKEMGDKLFKLAWDLGWLNLVDREAATDEPVYAFFHPSFQEYFAALAIDDWHFFLNHVPHNPDQGIYRIFGTQWQEVILLWLGRENIQDEEKEMFVSALLEFEDSCGLFYSLRAYLFTAFCVAEFPQFRMSTQIIKQLIRWSLDYINIKNQESIKNILPCSPNKYSQKFITYARIQNSLGEDFMAIKFCEPIREKALESLLKTERIKLTNILITLIQELHLIKEFHDETIYEDIAYILGQIAENNAVAILAIVDLIKNDFRGIINAVYDNIENFGQQNYIVIKALIEIIKSNPHEDVSIAVTALGIIAEGNPLAAETLVEFMQISQNEEIIFFAAESLCKIDKNNLSAINILLANIADPYLRGYIEESSVLKSLGHLCNNNYLVIEALANLLENPDIEKDIRMLIAENLWKISKDEKYKYMAINSILNVIKTTEIYDDDKSYWEIRILLESLEIVGKNNFLVIETISKLIKQVKNERLIIDMADILETIDRGNSLAIQTLCNLIKTTTDKEICRLAAVTLGYRDKRLGINVLVALIKVYKDKDDEFYRRVTKSLFQINQGSMIAICAFIEIIKTSNCQLAINDAIISLGQIKSPHFEASSILIKVIQSYKDTSPYGTLLKHAASSLKKIIAKEQMSELVNALKDCLSEEIYKNDPHRFDACYEVLWHCAQKMSYPDFYRAWHSKPSTTHSEASQNIPVGNSITVQQLNFAQFPAILRSAIVSDSTLNQAVQLICIDGSQFRIKRIVG
jgi:DNA polymerase III delta prime subunit/transcriptional regulator with XRE-family HTH domain